MISNLPHAHAGTVCHGRFRLRPEGFRVTEQLIEAPSGEGEHSLVLVEKTGQNTAWVARWLARAAGCAQRDVGYCGLKDRHAVCRQWFSVPRTVQMADLDPPVGVTVVGVERHHRKLRLGSHAENHFELELELDQHGGHFLARVRAVAEHGCPNWFGAQRFGRDGGNLTRARSWFESGARVRRDQRGFMLSAARAELFNCFLALRVRAGTWNQACDGDVLNLDGSGSVFAVDAVDADIVRRVETLDVHPTGPLWGRGEAVKDSGAADRERELLADESALMEGLEANGLRAERRALRMVPGRLTAAIDEAQRSATLAFSLRPGQFATAVLQEIGVFSDGAVAENA